MQIEDRLDVLLASRLSGSPSQLDDNIAADEELAPLLRAFDELAPLREARPSEEFTRDLEVRLLAYAASLNAAPSATSLPQPVSRDNQSSTANTAPLASRSNARRRSISRSLWGIVAAAVLLLVIGASALTAFAASAGPGSPLFGLRRAEQNIRVQLASSQGDKVRLHLSFATEALAQVNSAVAQGSGDSTYTTALATFMSEQQAAVDALAALPSGSERATLTQQLTTLCTQARSDFHTALHSTSWTERVATTQALGALGETIPVANDATVIRLNGPNEHKVRLIVTGSGFASGARVTVNGQVVGTLISATSTQLVVEIDTTSFHDSFRTIGVSNPDGTAVVSAHIDEATGSDQNGSGAGRPTPVTHPTPTPKPGHGHGNNGGNGGGR